MRVHRPLLVALVVFGWTWTPSGATVGGPDLAIPMGWSPSTKEVYFRIDHATGDTPSILRLQVGVTRKFQEVWWSAHAGTDSIYSARVTRLERTLVPLRPKACGSIPMEYEVVRLDTVERFQNSVPRFQVRIGAFEVVGGGPWIVETYRDSTVRLIGCYEIPGREEWVGVISFVGLPVESCYEVQVPVLSTARPESLESLEIPWR